MVRKWHDHVQPLINAKYKPWPRGINEKRVRADVRWDRRGGGKLRKFYEHGCGMTPVSGRSARISLLRSSRSGDYFKMDDAAARSFCRRYDANRI